jgi:hypothetical protein
MTDLYDQRIDAMKARERKSQSSVRVSFSCAAQDVYQDFRNAERLAAYKRKRAILDALEESGTLPEYTADEMMAWVDD